MSCGFKGTEKDYTAYIDVMDALEIPQGAKVLDYGSSWGYGTWQLENAGFNVQGFEISQPRARLAREVLRVDSRSIWDEIDSEFDVIFSAHVLEHIACVAPALQNLWRRLAEGGILLAFTPNGSLDYRAHVPRNWHKLWGYVHPNMMDANFFRHHFVDSPLLLASNPYPRETINAWKRAGRGVVECSLSGDELLVIALKTR